ncbi:general transcription factor 3C polypeptide 3-like [Haliotis cracherodii]|uniref:general transcription factor 3C polypeptide 3-like n=1 Tax=Haliotis cracherodii TaxID=6455 RepID=UPI0039EC886C
MAEEAPAGAKEKEQAELFRYLQGEISYSQYQKWKEMKLKTGGLIEESEDDITMSEPQPGTSSCELLDSPSKMAGKEWMDLFSAAESELTVQYITGKITFEEFSNKMENRQQEAGEEDDDIEMTGVSYDPSKVVVKKEPVEGEEEEEEEEEAVGSDEEMMYEDDTNDKDWVPSASEHYSESSTTPTTKKEKMKKKKKLPLQKEKKKRTRRMRKNEVPKHLQGLMGEANLRFARGEKEEAIKMCMEIIRLAPNAYLPFQTLGMIYEEMEQLEKAMQFFLIAAHLRPDDSEEWVRLAELSLEQNNTKQAVLCFNKAVRYAPDNSDCIWQRSHLYEQLGEHKKALEGYQLILKLLPDDDGEKYLQLARNITKSFHEIGETMLSINTMKNALHKHPNLITSEDVNLLLELQMAERLFLESIEVLVSHCGVEVLMPNTVVWNSESPETPVDPQDKAKSPLSCFTPDLLPIDLRVKLIICLVNLNYVKVAKGVCHPLLVEDVEETGDLYFDVAEAYMENGHYTEAKPILKTLVSSEHFNKAAVWLKYGECLNSLGELQGAVEAYTQCVEKAPGHFGARVSLSALQQQLGKHEEALQVLSRDEQDDLSEDDQMLLLHKCHLLHSQNKVMEFHTCCQKLLFSSFLSRCNANFMKIVFSYRTHKHRADALRTFIAYQDKTGKDNIQTMAATTEGKKMVKVDDLWDIYKQLFESLVQHDKYENLLEITTLGLACPQFMNDPVKVKESDFMCLTACMLMKNGQFAYNFVKDECMKNLENNQAWNLFGQVMSFAMDIRHNRFALRLCLKHPEVRALGIINGHNSLISGTYKHSLGEYMAVFRQTPRDPLISLCIGLCFIHMVCQKFTTKKHYLFTQGLAFLNNYVELRGECQETLYNLGRAMHQLELKYAAVYYYKKALACPPIIKHDKGIFDLSMEIAHNLALIYMKSGSHDLARMVVEQYCVI